MEAAKVLYVTALLFGVILLAPIGDAAAVTAPPASPQGIIFVLNSFNVDAYPIDGDGDVSPIALTVGMAAPRGIARDVSGRIYVTNSAINTITVYAADANGNVPPTAIIGGPDTGLNQPTGIALDASGKIYVLNGGENQISVYAPLGVGTGILDEAPESIIAGSQTLLSGPMGIAVDSLGNIYIVNGTGGPGLPGSGYPTGVVTVYAAGSEGNVAPVKTISGATTGLINPGSIALDRSGDIYVANVGVTFYDGTGEHTYEPSITIYSAGSTGNAEPIARITGKNVVLGEQPSMAVDSSGNLYVTTGSVSVYPAGSDGDVPPAVTIVGSDTGLETPNGVVLDAVGNLYVLNGTGGPTQSGSVTVYAAGSTGDAAPTATITSNFNGLDQPLAIATDSSGKIYVANASSPAGYNSIAIYAPGSYGISPPTGTIMGDQTGLAYPVGIAVVPNGKIAVLNDNNTITEYPAGSSGNVAPLVTITIATNPYNNLNAIAAGPSGEIYVLIQQVRCGTHICTENGAATIAAYTAYSGAKPRRIATIGGPNTKLTNASAMAVDRHGYIYVTNQGVVRHCPPNCSCSPPGPGTITVYAPGSNGDVKPTTTISGPNTRLGLPYGIALDWSGNIYVLNEPGGFRFELCSTSGFAPAATTGLGIGSAAAHISGPILVFAAGSSGDVAPIDAIGGPSTGLGYYALGIAVGPSGP